MIDKIVRFDDGAAYERMMGIWSRRIGEEFLDWLNLPTGLKCVDVGCGNGAFTELLVERCRPAEVQGIDPSPQQIEFSRANGTARETRNFVKATRRHFRSPTTDLMPPPWRWSSSLFQNRHKALLRWPAWSVQEVSSQLTRGTWRAEGFR